MEATIRLEDGVILGKENFAIINAKGKRFIERHAHKYMRENLWTPFYRTVENGQDILHVIHLPDEKPYEKIFFKRFIIKHE